MNHSRLRRHVLNVDKASPRKQRGDSIGELLRSVRMPSQRRRQHSPDEIRRNTEIRHIQATARPQDPQHLSECRIFDIRR